MNKKRLNWNKNNIEIGQTETERLMMKSLDDDDKRMTYGIIRALLWAVGFILDEMHREKKCEEKQMANTEVRVGDKFVVEVGHVYWSPTLGNRYFVKGFNSMVLDDYAIAKLEKYKEPPKEVPHICENCKYRHHGKRDYPCSLCENNYDVETEDMFVANGK